MNYMLYLFRAILDPSSGLICHSSSEREPLSIDVHTKFQSQKAKLLTFGLFQSSPPSSWRSQKAQADFFRPWAWSRERMKQSSTAF